MSNSEFMESKVNRLERELAGIKENQIIKCQELEKISEELLQSLETTKKCQILIDQNQNQLKKKEGENDSLREENKKHKETIEILEKMMFNQIHHQEEKEDITTSWKNMYATAFSKFKDSESIAYKYETQNNLLQEKLIQANEHLQRKNEEIQEIKGIYEKRSLEREEQFSVLNQLIQKMQSQIKEADNLKEFLSMHEQLLAKNSQVEEVIFGESQIQNVSSNDLEVHFQEALIENENLSVQLTEFEKEQGQKWKDREIELKQLNNTLTELRERNTQLEKKNAQLEGDIKKSKESEEWNEEILTQPYTSLTKNDIFSLQRSLIQERTIRKEIEAMLKKIQDEMKKKQPILKKQNEKWLKLNYDFLHFEKEHSKLQKECKENQAEIADLKKKMQHQLSEKEKGEIKNEFLKEEIKRLASQIQHLLKVNFALKQELSTKLGKQHLETLIDKIKADRNSLNLNAVDDFYQSSFSCLYSDIPEMVEINLNLQRQIFTNKFK